MTKEGRTKIVNFMTPGPWVLMLGHDHIGNSSEYVLSFTQSIHNTSQIGAGQSVGPESESLGVRIQAATDLSRLNS